MPTRLVVLFLWAAATLLACTAPKAALAGQPYVSRDNTAYKSVILDGFVSSSSADGSSETILRVQQYNSIPRTLALTADVRMNGPALDLSITKSDYGSVSSKYTAVYALAPIKCMSVTGTDPIHLEVDCSVPGVMYTCTTDCTSQAVTVEIKYSVDGTKTRSDAYDYSYKSRSTDWTTTPSSMFVTTYAASENCDMYATSTPCTVTVYTINAKGNRVVVLSVTLQPAFREDVGPVRFRQWVMYK